MHLYTFVDVAGEIPNSNRNLEICSFTFESETIIVTVLVVSVCCDTFVMYIINILLLHFMHLFTFIFYYFY